MAARGIDDLPLSLETIASKKLRCQIKVPTIGNNFEIVLSSNMELFLYEELLQVCFISL